MNADDLHLTLDTGGRVGGVGGIDHDIAAEIAADGAARRLRRIGRPEHGTDLGDRIRSLIDQDQAFGLRVLKLLFLPGVKASVLP